VIGHDLDSESLIVDLARRVRQSGGFPGVASVAGVVLLLPAWPYCLLAFAALFR
jgi:hypothetical protein